MIEYLDTLDKTLFLFLNSIHTPVTDKIWLIITNIPTWIPLYISLLIWIIAYHKKNSIWIILGIVLAITITDQLTSGFMKPFFGRLRPCQDPEIGPLTNVVNKCGGLYGFVSGHSANSFTIATFIWMVFRQKFRWVILLFLWAALVAFSRIMVGVHYPLDILIGGLIGFITGWLIFKLTEKLYYNFKKSPLIKN